MGAIAIEPLQLLLSINGPLIVSLLPASPFGVAVLAMLLFLAVMLAFLGEAVDADLPGRLALLPAAVRLLLALLAGEAPPRAQEPSSYVYCSRLAAAMTALLRGAVARFCCCGETATVVLALEVERDTRLAAR